MFQKDAIVHLLQDNDPETVSLLKEQLVESGPEAIPALKDLLTLDDAGVTAHVREVLDEIGIYQAQEEIALFTHLFPENGDIEEACWLLARCLDPGVEVDKRRRKLDAWGRRLKMLAADARTSAEQLSVLTGFFADELGFRGNADEYYDPRNSLLSSVVENRVGIPISLTVVYMIVARRAGLRVDGINLPGHFIARFEGTFFDPFHQGRILSATDCEAILARQKLKPQPGYFAPASSRIIFVRMLANLLFIFERAGDDAMHKQVLGWLRALDRK
jgi:regulator of sirC expression with transglutaminase-like and TPR domain